MSDSPVLDILLAVKACQIGPLTAEDQIREIIEDEVREKVRDELVREAQRRMKRPDVDDPDERRGREIL